MRGFAAEHLLPGEGDDIELIEIEPLGEGGRGGVADGQSLAVGRDEAGIHTEETGEQTEQSSRQGSGGKKEMSQLEELEIELQTAIETENYEKAAKIRDQIKKLKG
jgi:hypothetical protein